MTNGRRTCRSGQHCAPRTLAEVIYHVVHHSEMGAAVIAERLGVRPSYLLDAANPDREEVQFQARLIVPLINATGDYSILEWLADQVGCLVEPRQTDGVSPDPARELLDVVDRLGTLASADRDATRDGVRDAEEVIALKARAHAVVREVSEYIAALEK